MTRPYDANGNLSYYIYIHADEKKKYTFDPPVSFNLRRRAEKNVPSVCARKEEEALASIIKSTSTAPPSKR